jgi:hypothetical protein
MRPTVVVLLGFSLRAELCRIWRRRSEPFALLDEIVMHVAELGKQQASQP